MNNELIERINEIQRNTNVKIYSVISDMYEEIKRLTIENANYVQDLKCINELEAKPDGYVLVPVEPTLEQIEFGAMAMASWNEDCKWPESWSDLQVFRMRKEARSAYIAMLSAVKEKNDEQ